MSPPSRFAPDVPAWLDALVLDLMATEPNDRPGARRVVQRVEDATGQPLERREPEPVAPAATPHEEPHLVAVIGGVAVIVGALIVGGAVIVSSGVVLLVTLLVAA